MTRSRFTAVGITAATALVLAGCGQAADEASDAAVQPPQPVRVAQGAGAATANAELGGDAAISAMPAFVGFTFEAGAELPALPTNATGHQYPPGATVGSSEVAELAGALGVDGEPSPGGGADVDGLSWRVGPDDGSAPTLTVGADPQLSVNYSQAWSTGVGTVGCVGAEVVEPALASDSPAVSPPDATCDEPEPPADVPSADEAEALAADVLEGIGLDPATFEFETYADEWAASVSAWMLLDGVRSPISWGFGYGENAELQWMNGTLATPVATGPYPLIGLDDALDRLEERHSWFGGGGVAPGDVAVMSDSAGVAESGVEPAQPVPVEGEPAPPIDTVPIDTVPIEVTEEVATLVDVRSDLWWAWDDDGSVWLLPAYTFTDAEERVFTVPAVTDEFLVIAEPTPVDPMPVDPMPAEPPTDVVEPGDGYGIVGLGVDDATAVLEADGLTLRVVIEDGEALAVTEDFSTSRVNVEVTDGVVVAVVSVG